MLSKKDVMEAIRKQMAIGLLQDVILSLQDVLEKKGHLLGTVHGQKTDMPVREKLTASRSSEVRWNRERNQYRRIDTDLL